MLSFIFEFLYFIFGLTGCYFVVKKKRVGWFLWLVSTPLIVTVLFLKGAYITIPVFFIYGWLDWLGLKEWKK